MREFPTGTVTLLFTNIEGSTHLLQQLGESYVSILEEHCQLLRAAFLEFHGHEVDTQGDAFFVAFARATDAMAAAITSQRALASHSWSDGVEVRVRMGLHTGEPSLVSEDYVGLDVHYAARIMRAAHGGQVLLSQATHDLVEHDLPDGVNLRDLGEHRLKDFQRPGHLYQLVIADLPADFPPLKTLDSSPNNLPVQLTPLIGREQEIAALSAYLRQPEARLLTLTGTGGVGKTRLGLQIVTCLLDDFADGVRFIPLMDISDPDLVVPTIGRTVGLQEVGDQPLFDLLKAFLREKHLLLLLDNFEQVVAAASRLTDLLAACPRLKILVTSRAVLRISGEYEFVVSPLPVPDLTQLPGQEELLQYPAIALFLQRARMAVPDFHMTDANARTIAEICTHLDGLPLAIELATPWLKLLSPHLLLARLDHRLQVLISGARDVPVRQQTLRNTLEWSYYLLSLREQQLFRYLSVFANGCTLGAIEAVCAALSESDHTDQVLEGIASLLDKSMLQRTAQEGEEPRLGMLKTIREYGLECLTTNMELESTQRAHAMYYLTLVEEAEPELVGTQQTVWLERLEREHDNLRAALQWAIEQGERGKSEDVALRLGKALQRFWITHGHVHEGYNLLKRVLAASQEGAASTRGNALLAAAALAYHQYDYSSAAVLSEESLILFREQGNQQGIASSLTGLGHVARMRGDFTAAHALYEESLTISRRGGYQYTLAETLYHLSFMAGLQRDYAAALTMIEEPLQLFRKIGDQRSIAYTLGLKGLVLLRQGDVRGARFLEEESLAIFRKIRDQRGIAYALNALGQFAYTQGDLVLARAEYEESLALTLQLGERWMTAVSLDGLGRVVAAQGQPVWATRLWSTGEVLREAIGAPRYPTEKIRHEQALATTRTLLKEQAFLEAWTEGRTMSPEQALAAQESVLISMPTPAEPPSTPPAKSSPIYPDGLTARQVEVLCLLAQGLTDGQIAEHLVISPRTVNNHLTAVYSKIGVSSRSAATRYAIEHQLL